MQVLCSQLWILNILYVGTLEPWLKVIRDCIKQTRIGGFRDIVVGNN